MSSMAESDKILIVCTPEYLHEYLPEVATEQLQAALKDIGIEARREAFSAGRPVIMLKNDAPVWVYADGTEVPAIWKNGTHGGGVG